MSAYNRAHQLRIDGQSEPDTDDRVAAITEQLVNERMESPRHVAEALDELAGTSDHNSDGNTHFAADMALVLDSSDVAFEAHAVAFFHKLRDQVRTYLARDASTDADFRVSKGDDDAAEARDTARMGWAA